MSKTLILAGSGLAIGLPALLLGTYGNPPNMGVCVARFLRDVAGGTFGGEAVMTLGILFVLPVGVLYSRLNIRKVTAPAMEKQS